MDIADYIKEPIENTFIYYDEDNVFEIYLLIIGPKSTPYEGGFYFFKILFPNEYPYKNPDVKFLTTQKHIRFNPNLYDNGRVCLSILGTWSGPEWSSVMTMTSLILSLQSLLIDNPLRNEPGFDNENTSSPRNIAYNKILTYYNWSFAIIEMLKSPVVLQMKDIVKTYYNEHKETYIEKLDYLQKTEEPNTVKSIYGMHEYINYKKLVLE
jgi:ubiquitin-conjugating enzyme E2 Z